MPHIHASEYNVGEAWVVFDDHRRNNWEPYIYHTKDYGATWSRVVDGGDVEGFVYVFTQDPEVPSLWFCGTDVGLYFSIDAGANWNRWTNGFPTTPVMDLVVHPRDGDLVIGTFGRAFWILDDIRPLRELASNNALTENALHAFAAPDAVLASIGESHGYRHGKVGEVLYNGENRDYGALITFHVKEIQGDEDTVMLTIADANGNTVRHLETTISSPGMHRVNWNLSRDMPRMPNQKKPEKPVYRGGAKVPPGAYFVNVQRGSDRAQTSVLVVPDPRMTRTMQEFTAKDEMVGTVYELIEEATAVADELRDLEERIGWIQSSAKASGVELDQELMTSCSAELQALKERLLGKEVQGIYRQPDVVRNVLGQTTRMLDILDPATSNQRNQLESG